MFFALSFWEFYPHDSYNILNIKTEMDLVFVVLFLYFFLCLLCIYICIYRNMYLYFDWDRNVWIEMNGCYSYTVLLALVVTLMSFEFVCSNIILTSHHYNSQRTASAVLWYSRIKSIYNVFFFIHSIMRPFIHNNSTKPSLVVHNQNM